jgi:hypothetical protein
MSSRKNRRANKQCGGVAPLDSAQMNLGQRNSLDQGTDYLRMHKGQYGGSASYPSSFGATLPSSMVPAARTGPLDSAIGAIQGMQDGGRRRRKTKASRKSRKTKASRKNRKSKASRKTRKGKASRKNRKHTRKHRGGYRNATGASLSESSMLLPSGMEAKAALNNEWGLAKDPNAFAPKA